MRFSSIYCRILLLLNLFSIETSFGDTETIKHTSAKIELDFDLDEEQLPRNFRGSITYELAQQPANGEICLYLPYNDPYYGNTYTNIIKTNISAAKSGGNLFFYGGSTEVTLDNRSYQIEYISGHIMKISRKNFHNKFTLNFKNKMPRLDKSDPSEWFFDGFYPTLLNDCDIAVSRLYETDYMVPMDFDVNINTPNSWSVAAPNMSGKNEKNKYESKNFVAKKFSFALLKNSKRQDLNIEGIPVSIFYHSESFEKLIPTLKKTIPPTINWLGEFPFKNLTILESLEVQSDSTPGMVIFNKPRQASFDKFQTEYTNWRDWIFTSMVVSQWVRTVVFDQNRKDSWMLQGIVEFLTLKIITQNFEKIDFFRKSEGGFKLFSSTYRHSQDMLASLLSNQDPLGTLTDNNFNTIHDYEEQNPLIYIKHAIALRQLADYISESELKNILMSFLKSHYNKKVTPQDFIKHIYSYQSQNNTEKRRDIVKQLKQWWTKNGWPDFELTDIEKTKLDNGKWLVNATFIQKSNLNLSAKVLFEDVEGNKFLVQAKPSTQSEEPTWVASITLDHKLNDVTIDPEYASFDNDRFNNTSASPGIKFFPGNAETLSETDYTTFWFPYAYRNLGEPVSIAVAGAIFKHINQGIFFKFAGTVQDNLGSFDLSHRRTLPAYALGIGQSFSQDYYGSRTALLSFSRKPLFSIGPNIGLGLKFRYRQTVGQPDTIHYTYSTDWTLTPTSFSDYCNYKFSAEFEHAPGEVSHSFSYMRSKGTIDFGCSIMRRNNISFRIFRGYIKGNGTFPDLARFKINDGADANVAIDDNSIPLSESVASASSAISLPLWLPYLTNSVILSRKLNISFFYDYGKFMEKNDMYFKASGTRIILPLGGDVAGSSSVTISQINISMIYYTNIDGAVSYEPHFLFGLTGSL